MTTVFKRACLVCAHDMQIDPSRTRAGVAIYSTMMCPQSSLSYALSRSLYPSSSPSTAALSRLCFDSLSALTFRLLSVEIFLVRPSVDTFLVRPGVPSPSPDVFLTRRLGDVPPIICSSKLPARGVVASCSPSSGNSTPSVWPPAPPCPAPYGSAGTGSVELRELRSDCSRGGNRFLRRFGFGALSAIDMRVGDDMAAGIGPSELSMDTVLVGRDAVLVGRRVIVAVRRLSFVSGAGAANVTSLPLPCPLLSLSTTDPRWRCDSGCLTRTSAMLVVSASGVPGGGGLGIVVGESGTSTRPHPA